MPGTPSDASPDAHPAPDGVGAAAPRMSAVRWPHIDPARCTGCGRCVGACGPHLLSLEVAHWKKSAVLHDAERCTGCRLCERRCPFGAITMVARPGAPEAKPQDLTNAHNDGTRQAAVAPTTADIEVAPVGPASHAGDTSRARGGETAASTAGLHARHGLPGRRE